MSLSGLTCREGGLDLFHAAGRVVYNKRFGDDPDDAVFETPPLPPHLHQWIRRQSKVDIDVHPPRKLVLLTEGPLNICPNRRINIALPDPPQLRSIVLRC